MEKYLPNYTVKHIDHKDDELQTENYQISSSLSNGKQLRDGGLGYYAQSDFDVIVEPSGNNKYDYLKMKIFLQKKVIKVQCYILIMSHLRNTYFVSQALKHHCEEVAKQCVGKIAFCLSAWLSPRNADKAKEKFIFLPQDIKKQELNSIFVKNGINNDEWNVSASNESLNIEYDKSLEIFGHANIVKTIRPQNGTTYILSITQLSLKYLKKKSKNLKISCFVQRV